MGGSLNSTILLNDQTILNNSYVKPTDAIVGWLLEFERFSRYGFVTPYIESLASQMQSIPYIISCRWQLLTLIWKYSVIFIIEECLAIWLFHKLLKYSRSGKGARSVRNWSISEFLFIVVGLLQSNIATSININQFKTAVIWPTNTTLWKKSSG